jgi:hypothetical protein
LKVNGVAIIFPFDNHYDVYEESTQDAQSHQANLNRASKFLEKPGLESAVYDIVFNLEPKTPLDVRKILIFRKTCLQV